jgi:hypothetical protein
LCTCFEVSNNCKPYQGTNIVICKTPKPAHFFPIPPHRFLSYSVISSTHTFYLVNGCNLWNVTRDGLRKAKSRKGTVKTRAQTPPAPIRKKRARPALKRASPQRQPQTSRYTDKAAFRHWNLQLSTNMVSCRHSIHRWQWWAKKGMAERRRLLSFANDDIFDLSYFPVHFTRSIYTFRLSSRAPCPANLNPIPRSS